MPPLRYVLFSTDGRINRRTYWIKGLIPLFAVLFVLGVSQAIIDLIYGPSSNAVIFLFPLGLLSIGIAWSTGAKRLHDIGWSAWWVVLCFIPLVGLIPLLVLGLLPGTNGPNKYAWAAGTDARYGDRVVPIVSEERCADAI